MRPNKAFYSACNENCDNDHVFEVAAMAIHAILLSARSQEMLQDFDIDYLVPEEKCIAQSRKYILKGPGFDVRHAKTPDVKGDVFIELSRHIPEFSREMSEPYSIRIGGIGGNNARLVKNLPYAWILFHDLDEPGAPLEKVCESLRTVFDHLNVKTEFLMETRPRQGVATWKPRVI